MGKINIDNIIFETLLTERISDDDTPDESFEFIYHLICKEFIVNDKLTRIPYDIIAKYVFDSSEGYAEDNEILNENLQKLIESSSVVNKENIEKFADKFKGHYKLCKEQKEYIQKNIDFLNNEVASARKEVNDIITVVNETEEQSKNLIEDSSLLIENSNNLIEDTNNLNIEMMETKDKLLSEFVGILGIFSALIFGLFGGFEGLSTSLSLIATDIPLGKTIMASAAVIVTLISFLYTMVQWIGKLIGKPIKSCGCTANDDCINNHNFADRHSTFLLVIGIVVIIFLFGLLIMLGKVTGVTDVLIGWSYNWILFGIIGTSIIVVFTLVSFNVFKKVRP